MADSEYALMGFRQMVDSDMQGGTITYAGITYDATVTPFSLQPTLISGGFSPMLTCTVMVARDDLPPNTVFKPGQIIIASPSAGAPRACKVVSMDDLGPLVQITLNDAQQKA